MDVSDYDREGVGEIAKYDLPYRSTLTCMFAGREKCGDLDEIGDGHLSSSKLGTDTGPDKLRLRSKVRRNLAVAIFWNLTADEKQRRARR
jgi:hypothetical protein